MAQKRPDRTLGGVHDTFWQYCNQGELRLQSCSRCNRTFWPPMPVCDTCGTFDLEWKPLSGRGKVVSFCTFERQYYDELPPPVDCIVVKLEEGPQFLSNPQGFTWKDISFELPVKLTFIDCEDAAGPFKLPVFERA
ncbi:MAG: hypothetical protein EXR43_02780 [Dehalococcoidia bacterium]|nr:hypothetical protein [Dehalococcoidia bacterium]